MIIEELKNAKTVMVWNTIVLMLVVLSTSFMIWKCFQILYAKTENDVKLILNKEKNQILVSSMFNFLASIMFMEYVLRFRFLSSPVDFEIVILSFNVALSFFVLLGAISLHTGKSEWCVKKAIASVNSMLLVYMTQVLLIITFLGTRWNTLLYKV